MNADEIVMILRGQKGDPDFNFYAGGDIAPLITSATLNAAADLIESLQADLRHEEKVSHGQMEQNKRLRKMMDKLQANLAESQRRERAAVELIGKVSQAVDVAFNATDYVKPNTGIWHTLGLALDWIKAWRGTQEAGKGETARV